jgi:hypothetical protein
MVEFGHLDLEHKIILLVVSFWERDFYLQKKAFQESLKLWRGHDEISNTYELADLMIFTV